MTEDAKDLIKHMLVAAPEKRICAQAALHHKWFLVNESALMRVKLTLTQSELRDMRSNARFRRAANAVMVANRLKVLSSGRSLSSGSSLSTISSGGTSASASTISSASSASSLSRSGHTGSVSSLSSSSVGDSKHGSEDAASSKGNGDSLGRSGSARSRSSSATLEGGAAAAAAAYHGSSSNDHIHDGVMRRGPSAAGSGASRTSAPSSPVTVSAGRAAGDAAGAKAAADWAASCTPPGTRSGERVHGKTVSFGYDDRREEDDLDTRRHAGMAAAGEAEELKVDTTTWM